MYQIHPELFDAKIVTNQTLGGTAITWRMAHVGPLHVAYGSIGRLSDEDWAALSGDGELVAILPTEFSIGGVIINSNLCYVDAISRNAKCAYGGLRTIIQSGASRIGVSRVAGSAPSRDYPGWMLAVYIEQ